MIEPKQVFSFLNEIRESEPGIFVAKWTVPDGLAYVDGHFPGNPVLPGVAFVDACYEICAATRPGAAKMDEHSLSPGYIIKEAKFISTVEPKSEIEIQAQWLPSGICEFSWWKVTGVERKLCAQLTFECKNTQTEMETGT